MKKVKLLYNKMKLSFDRSFSGQTRKQFFWLLSFFTLACVTLLLLSLPQMGEEGYLHSMFRIFSDMVCPVSLRENAYEIQRFSFYETFRLILAYVAGITLFNGMLIATLSNILRTRSDAFRDGKLFYALNEHVIVLGYDPSVPHLIKTICEDHPNKHIVLQTVQSVEYVRSIVYMDLSVQQKKKVIVVHANRNSCDDLNRLCITTAYRVYILGENNEHDRDALNLDCFQKITDCVHNRKNELPCFTLIQNYFSYALSRSSNVIIASLNSDDFLTVTNLIPLNFERTWARKVFVECGSKRDKISYLPLDRNGIYPNSDASVHLVILGMSNMGLALAMEAAHITHYPNFIIKGKKTKITLVDRNAQERLSALLVSQRYLFACSKYSFLKFEKGKEVKEACFIHVPEHDFLDIEWEFIQSDVYDAEFQRRLVKWTEDSHYLTIAMCFNLSEMNMQFAFSLPDELFDERISILVWQKLSVSMNYKFLSQSKYANIRPFGMLNEGNEVNDTFRILAKRINYMYYMTLSSLSPVKNYSDPMVEDLWKHLSVVKKWSNIYSAIILPTFQRSLSMNIPDLSLFEENLTDEYLDLMAETEHNRWNVEELILGYRPTTKNESLEIEQNPEKKELYKKRYVHYDIRPFKELKKNTQGKDTYSYDYIKILSLPYLMKLNHE